MCTRTEHAVSCAQRASKSGMFAWQLAYLDVTDKCFTAIQVSSGGEGGEKIILTLSRTQPSPTVKFLSMADHALPVAQNFCGETREGE